MRRCFIAFTVAAVAALASAARADAATQPGWNPASRPGFACGSGFVPRGRAPREIAAANGSLALNMTVKQADDQLCYVVDGIAEAPLLRLHPGDKLAITLKNEIADPSYIDTFVPIRYLPKATPAAEAKPGFMAVVPGMRHEATGATNLHMHGFPVPPVAPQDDVMTVCADPAVGPQRCGRRQIDYVFQLPKDMPTGLYWYHPHVHGETQPQILMGLSGAVVVEGPEDEARRAAGIEDRVLIVRQTADSDARQILPVPPGEATPQGHMHDMHDMHEGHGAATASGAAALKIDTDAEIPCGQMLPEPISLNGASVTGGRPPDDDIAPFAITAGGRQLWRVVNGATDFYLNLVVLDEQGRAQPIQVASWDGVAQADDRGQRAPLTATTAPQLVAPAGRVEFLLSAPPAGKSFFLVSRKVDTGCAGDANPERWLARIVATPAPAAVPASAAMPSHDDGATHSAIGLFAGLLAVKPAVHRTLALAEYPRPGMADQSDFYLTEVRPGAVLKPFEMGGPPNFTVKSGVVEEWDIENWTRELHAFHTHQVHFRVMAVDGKPQHDPPLLDVVNVPFATPVDPAQPNGPLKPGRVRIRLMFPKEFVGDVPIHCHLVDHEDNGMMALVRVTP